MSSVIEKSPYFTSTITVEMLKERWDAINQSTFVPHVHFLPKETPKEKIDRALSLCIIKNIEHFLYVL